jgi:uncharacterized protein (DUF488 family)
MDEAITLYTIGHSNITANDFLALLQQHNINVVVDVRSAPFSKYSTQYNKGDLHAFLDKNRVDYRFAGKHLGGRPPHADVYEDNKLPDKEAKRQDFLQSVQYKKVMQRDWYQKGISHLIRIIQETTKQGGNVAIMCSEGNPQECHRHHLIARSLIDKKVKFIKDIDVNVHHILKGGSLQSVNESMFEEIIQERLL